MINKPLHDIDDDEIRIVGLTPYRGNSEPPKKKKKFFIFVGLVLIVVIILLCIFVPKCSSTRAVHDDETLEIGTMEGDSTEVSSGEVETPLIETGPTRSSVTMCDTLVSNTPLVIIYPRNMKPSLRIGAETLDDTTVMVAVQAADIRRDTGGIVGAFVKEGELISRGQSKSGFCAIINNKIHLGVAETTPYFEEAIETDGYFFRQYPLVVAGQIVENKPQNTSFRKALAELNGEIVVIISRNKMTFQEFSESLVDLGVSNAIYLVGSTAYGLARLDNGETFRFGTKSNRAPAHTSYLVWQ